MMLACLESNAEFIRQLLDHKVNVEHKDSENRNCLFYIIDNKKKEEGVAMMTIILDCHPSLANSTASNNKSLLIAAVEKCKPELVKVLLEKGANPNQSLSDTRNRSIDLVETPLHIAMKNWKPLTEKNFKTIIVQLLMYRADTMIKNKKGKAPIEMDGLPKAFLLDEIEKLEKKRQQVVLRVND
jgi:ankyrin repeat protein